MSFEDLLTSRSAAVYADFLEPHITSHDLLLDVGCGSGSITVGLAAKLDHVIGVDLDHAEFDDARTHARASGIDNVEFREGSVYELAFPDRPSTRVSHIPWSRRSTARSTRWRRSVAC